jgi:hypothetical protein
LIEINAQFDGYSYFIKIHTMKYILLTAVLLSGSTTYAQSISLGLRGGYNMNSTPTFGDQLTNTSGTNSFLLGLKATVDFKHFQAGAGFDYGRQRYMYETNTNTSLGSITLAASTPLKYSYLFANYKLGTSRSFAYFGGTIGYAVFGGKLNIMANDHTQWRVGGQKKALSGGLQAGYNLSLTKRWNLQGEVGARYIPLNGTYTSFDSDGESYETPIKGGAFSFPVTIGINYKIFK